MRQRATPRKHTIYYDLLDACKTQGCPVCALTLAAVRRYLDTTLYENVNDPQIRDTITASRGYCNNHSWQLREMGAGFGTALLYRDVLRHVAEAIGDSPDAPPPAIFSQNATQGGVFDRLAAFAGGTPAREQGIADPHTACPACMERTRHERNYLHTLAAHSGDEALHRALREAGGLCLVHLDQLIATTRDAAALHRLLQVQHSAMMALHGELSEFIRKHDYRFKDEGMGDEGTSWIRAIEMVAGKPGIR